jgi:hypothetical protein
VHSFHDETFLDGDGTIQTEKPSGEK